MPKLDIDFEVFKAITARRGSEDVTENDVLRSLLGLNSPSGEDLAGRTSSPDNSDWVVKGVRFRDGTEFRASYKGQTWLGRVRKGALEVGGKRYDSPSSAAMSITKSPVNGWTFWQYRSPGQSSWQVIKSLR